MWCPEGRVFDKVINDCVDPFKELGHRRTTAAGASSSSSTTTVADSVASYQQQLGQSEFSWIVFGVLTLALVVVIGCIGRLLFVLWRYLRRSNIKSSAAPDIEASSRPDECLKLGSEQVDEETSLKSTCSSSLATDTENEEHAMRPRDSGLGDSQSSHDTWIDKEQGQAGATSEIAVNTSIPLAARCQLQWQRQD